MTENDYLNPADLKAQCDAAIARLERDNEALGTVENSLDTFVNDEEIKSKSYDALKQQISDYKVLLHAMQDANSSDISDFTVLKASVGDEVLDGANILAQKQAAWQLRENDESAAQGYERASWTAEYPWESWYYSWMADHYWQSLTSSFTMHGKPRKMLSMQSKQAQRGCSKAVCSCVRRHREGLKVLPVHSRAGHMSRI